MKLCADSLTKTGDIQPSDGGAIPTSALHFRTSDSTEPRKFISQIHYSKSCPPGKFYFVAESQSRIVGALVFRKPSLPKVEKAYGADLELVRLAMLDGCQKNSESRFIGWALRWLKKQTRHRRVVSFSDPRFGHRGGIYRASNSNTSAWRLGTEPGA